MDFIIPLPPFHSEETMQVEKRGGNECVEISLSGGQGSQMQIEH